MTRLMHDGCLGSLRALMANIIISAMKKPVPKTIDRVLEPKERQSRYTSGASGCSICTVAFSQSFSCSINNRKTQRLHKTVQGALTTSSDQFDGIKPCCRPHLTPTQRRKRRLQREKFCKNIAIWGISSWIAFLSSGELKSCVIHIDGQLCDWRGPGEHCGKFLRPWGRSLRLEATLWLGKLLLHLRFLMVPTEQFDVMALHLKSVWSRPDQPVHVLPYHQNMTRFQQDYAQFHATRQTINLGIHKELTCCLGLRMNWA